MAETEDTMADLRDMMERAEGYLNDAEFREDYEMRQVRYLQAMSTLMLISTKQNEYMIELLKKAQM